jgi:hypothetical protein
MKRLSAIIIALLLLSASFLCTSTAFADEPIEIRIERIEAVLPDIKAYLYADDTDTLAKDDIKAALDGKALNVEDLKTFHDSGEGVTYILLVDVSTSITNAQMHAAKEALTAFSNDLKENEKMVLLPFGKRVEVLLGGGEDKAARENAIGMLANNQEGTAFYDAIEKAISIANGKSEKLPERAVAIAISDGVDVNNGGYTKAEVDTALSQGNLPLYALALDDSKTNGNTALDDFGAIARTSGGGIRVSDSAALGGSFDETISAINGCYVLYLKNENNVFDTNKKVLSVDISVDGRSASAEKEVYLKDWMPDTVAPTVVQILQLDEQNGIRIEFSEALIGADDKSAYTVTDKSGKPVAVQTVVYSAKGGTAGADVIFAGELYSGAYTVTFNGITDESMERNALAEKSSFSYKGASVFLKFVRTVFVRYWWICFIAVIVIIARVIFRVIRKRKGLIKVDGKIGFGDAVEFKHHFETPETSVASLIVADAKGNAHRVDLEINKSLFIGRSKGNNLSFDDTKMSRQHFVIEVENGEYYLSDLQTTNGTFLNGIKVLSRRKLENNDVITAGNEKFVFKAGTNA